MDEVYAYLQAYFRIEDYGYLNNYLGIDMDRRPDVSIHIKQPYLTQIIFDMIPGIEKSSANTTPAVKPTQAKNDVHQAIKMTLITGQ